jgi:hypothetical protein
VDRINGYPVYHLGAMLGQVYAAILRPDVTFGDLAGPALNAGAALVNFASDPALWMPLSKTAATNLAQVFAVIRSEENLARPEAQLGDARDTLLQILMYFQNVLLAELSELDLYFVSQKGGFNTKTLIFNAEHCIPLPNDIREGLGKQVTEDMRAAGQCLVFGLPTAAGFHMFRAVEAVVLMYFPILKLTPPGRNLGRYIEALNEAGVDARIIGMLTHLKDFYRNPLAHPDLFLTMPEAVGLFGIAPSAIAQMALDLEALRADPSTLTPRKTGGSSGR